MTTEPPGKRCRDYIVLLTYAASSPWLNPGGAQSMSVNVDIRDVARTSQMRK